MDLLFGSATGSGFGQTGVDHYAVQLDASFALSMAAPAKRHAPRIDVSRLREPASRDTVRAICQHLPLVEWHVDAHTHYSTVAEQLVQQLACAFPVQRASKKRDFFSDTTWTYRQQRVWLRRRIHHNIRFLAGFDIRIGFAVWKHGCSLIVAGVRTVARTLTAAFSMPTHVQELRSLKPALRKSIQKDRAEYLKSVAKSATRSTTKNVVDRLRPLLGPPKRRQKGVQPVPAVQLEDGTLAKDSHEAEARWIRHFSSIEAGEPQAAELIVANCLRRQDQQDLEDLVIDRQDLPTRVELEQGLRASPTARAAGKDKVPADVLHVAPAQLSLPIYQLLLKLAMRLQEPVQWKGGELHHVWKRKHSAALCSSHRAILVSSSLGKAVHSVFRRRCSPYLDAAATPLQVGGRRGFPVQMVMHAARLFQAASWRSGKSCALVFVDLCEAFHRVARPLVYGGPLCAEQIAGIVAALGLHESVMPRLHAYVTEQSLLRKAGASDWTSRVLAEFSQDSWFAHGGHEGTAIVRSGTRPGDNLADMIFSFLFSEILASLRKRFDAQGLRITLPWNDAWLCASPQAIRETSPDCEAKPVDITWMDDLALLVESTQPDELPDKVVAVASATVTECVQATLLPNLAAGKTEAVVSVQGRGAHKVKKDIFRGTDPSLQLRSDIWPAARLRIVPWYKHVGGLIEAGGGFAKEMRSRFGAAWSAFRQRRRQVFMSPMVTHGDKALLFSSLIESTLYYGVGTWPEVKDKAVARFQSVLISMARLMLRPTFSLAEAKHISASYALSIARILPADAAFRVERLRHFGIVISKANSELWALLHHERTWLEQIHEDLQWMRNMIRHAGQSADEVSTWEAVVLLVQSKPRRWKHYVRWARKSALWQAAWTAESEQFLGLLVRQLRAAGAELPADLRERETKEACAMCGKVFPDLRAWSHHAFKVHGRVREERLLVDGTQCPVCLKHFPNTEKLCNHVRYSVSCKDALLRAGFTAAPTPGMGSRRFDDGRRSQLPAIQAQGPKGQWSMHPGVHEKDRPEESVLLRLEDIFGHGRQEHPTFALLEQGYREAFSSVCLQSTRLKATALEWSSRLEREADRDEDQEILWMTWHGILARRLQEVDWVSWLVPCPSDPGPGLSTFKDAALVLPWLSLAGVRIESLRTPDQVGTCISDSGVSGLPCLPFLRFWADPPLDFEKEFLLASTGGLSVFSVVGLLTTMAMPIPVKSFLVLQEALRRLRLYSDMLRGILLLWLKGAPAVLIFRDLACSGLATLKAIAPYSSQRAGLFAIGNCHCVGLLSRFTSN